MEIKSKQRIIGGFVLVALAVIFLPLFFKGNNPIQKQVTLDAPIPPAPPKPALSETTTLFQSDELKVNQDNKPLNGNKTTSSTVIEQQQVINAGSQLQPAAQKPNPNEVAFGAQPMSATANTNVTNKTPINHATKLTVSADSNTTSMPKDAESISQQTTKTIVTATTIQAKNKRNEADNLTRDKKVTSVSKAKVTVNANTTKQVVAHHTSSSISSKTTVVKQEKLTAASAWVVQLGSFDKPEHAKLLTKKLRDKGFKAFTREMKTAKGTMTKVLVGPEIKRAKADALQVAINKDMKLKGIVVAFKPLEAKG